MNIELFELMQSIEKEGVLVPLLARPNPVGEGYELIAGHRRKAASKWAEVDKVPVMVVDFDDNQAVIAMVDSNLQRERIKPSEKAEEQYELHAVMNMEQCTPSLSQANRLKRMSQSGELDLDAIYLVLEEEKPNQREQIRIRSDRLNPYFPKEYTDRQKIELRESLVKEWYQEHMQSKSR